MQTKQYISIIKNHLPNINSILEIQCGDEYRIENCLALQDRNLQYIGVDIDDDVIRNNRQYFKAEKNKVFITLDASNEALPKTDLVLCLGMAPYLPIANIWSLLENIRDSEAKYFAFDFYNSKINDDEINADIDVKEDQNNVMPNKRAINLCQAPFYFPEPSFLIDTKEREHFIVLYKISEVGFFMDLYSDKLSGLRRRIFDRIDIDFKDLESVFLRENKVEMFQEMMVQFLKSNEQDHIQNYYLNESYSLILNQDGVLGKRNNFFRLCFRVGVDITAEDYRIESDDIEVRWAQIIAKDYIRWKFNASLFM
jgi:hypothetical protein